MSNQKLKEGDVVQLKSGGVEMTISAINAGLARCYWSHGKEVFKIDIPIPALRLSNVEPPTADHI